MAFMRDQAIGGQADDGEEQVEGNEIGRDEHAHAAGQRQQPPGGETPLPGRSPSNAGAQKPATDQSNALAPSNKAPGWSNARLIAK